jgi:hypothetical protein
MRDGPGGKQTRAVLRRLNSDFVALTLGDREFSRLANRRVLLETWPNHLGKNQNLDIWSSWHFFNALTRPS